MIRYYTRVDSEGVPTLVQDLYVARNTYMQDMYFVILCDGRVATIFKEKLYSSLPRFERWSPELEWMAVEDYCQRNWRTLK